MTHPVEGSLRMLQRSREYLGSDLARENHDLRRTFGLSPP